MAMEGNLLVTVDWDRPVFVLDGDDNLIFNFDFSAQPLSDGTNSATIKSAVSGAGFTYTRASVATCQTSANAIVTSGIAVDDPRIGDRGQGRGLFSEDGRTNVCQRARNVGGTGWGAGSTVTSGQTGPDGGTSAARVQTTSSATGTSVTCTTTANFRYVTSAWVKDAGSGGSEQMSTAGASTNAVATTPGGTWTRIEYIHADTGTSLTLAAADGTDQHTVGGTTAGARDTLIDLVQHENSGSTSGGETRATSAIITTGANATRSPDRLKLPWAKFSVNGRARLRIRFIPFFTLYSEESGNRYLVSDGTEYFYFSSGQPICRVGGTNSSAMIGFSQPAWAVGDLVEMYLEFGNGYPYFASRINGGQPYTVPSSSTGWSASHTTLALTADPHIMSWIDGTLKLQGLIQNVSGYAYESKPGWVP
jgi:hypothetical protein